MDTQKTASLGRVTGCARLMERGLRLCLRKARWARSGGLMRWWPVRRAANRDGGEYGWYILALSVVLVPLWMEFILEFIARSP
ncbi:hypothetical protein DYG63_19225 [Yersinia enterocolitica]|nr:hypothetical protein [Yersinia enterocolitica]EKN5104028.1 hypothetical protein [Yersinia enterocolitica]